MDLLHGLVTGALFGFLLQRGHVLRYDKQLGALRLVDLTIVKFMLSHILVAMVGIYLLHDLGLVKLSIKTASVGANLLGGLTFGLGWGLLGYCPGTSLGAVGEGRLDALWGVAGMLLGAALFAHTYDALRATVYTWWDLGQVTLPTLFGVNPWLCIALLAVAYIGVLRFIERKGL
jgi:uncharacterized protein